MTCTGVSASWCQIHGDCCCPTNECGETVDEWGCPAKNFEGCPLHSPSSTHGELQEVSTICGPVKIEE